ncbi:aldose 1-epimerase family protein [Allorhizocola rhizosphaerae]|uniref:aldose 1-epimerase family protein n=1 Tax=Allorhizocola rhizosphaerae TaxID=1872709 RepID=UPI000E3D9236|nr:aldose 1-epimerase family protein [Allorhizocola rhizosphaerae]
MAASGAQWTIRRGDQTAVIVEVGGGLRTYAAGGEEIVDGYGEDELCPGSAGQILAPWPNRLRDGAFRFEGESYQVPLSEPSLHNALHGLVRWSSWHAEEVADDSVTVWHRLHPQPGYPWELLLRAKYSIDQSGLTVRHTARNLSGCPVPFGLGTHPYVRIPGVPLNDLELSFQARTRLLVDGRQLPIGAAKVAGGDYDYSTPRRIGTTELNTAFGELSRDGTGRAAVTLTAPDGRGIVVWADGAFKWWQLFTGESLRGERRRRALAIEPMTCPPDALRSGRDLITLQPGEEWAGEWGIGRVQHAGATNLLERLA